MSMVAERKGKGRKSSLVRVGRGFKSEAKFREKLRGNRGSGEKDARPGDGVKLSLRDRDGNRQTFLPSESWIDTYFQEVSAVDDKGQPNVERYYDKATRSPLHANGPAPGMVRCRKCGHLTPRKVMERPWYYPKAESVAMDVLCAVPIASEAAVDLLAQDFRIGLAKCLRMLEGFRRRFGLIIFPDGDGRQWVSIPERYRARVIEATERYSNLPAAEARRPVIERPTCADCNRNQIHAAYGGSPSAAAIFEIGLRQRPKRETLQVKLKPEDKASLRREIKCVKRYRWVPRV